MSTKIGITAPGFKILPFVRPAPALAAAQRSEIPLARPRLVQAPRQPERRVELSKCSTLAHDARNALAALHLISGLLAEPNVLSPDHAHIAGDLQTVAKCLGSLVRGFELNGGVGEANESIAAQPEAQAADKSASNILKGCARLLQAVAGPNVAVHVSAESGLLPLRITSEALSRILTNLVKNASEAMPNGGTVRITARRALSLTAPAVLIHVTDDGPGIPAYALDQIFEPGFSSKQGGTEGCGLGLAIVRKLVEAVGGTVRVASTRRRGTTFELRLPCLARKR